MREDDEMQEPSTEPIRVRAPSLTTPAMDRAVELARELLRQQGWSDDEIESELNRPPGSGFPSF